MKKSDLLKLVEKLNDEEEVNELLVGTDIQESFKNGVLTLDNFKDKLKEKEFKSYIDSLNDTYHSKAVKTMKEKGTWETEFGDVLKSKYPDLVKDPIQIELMTEKKAREDLEAKLAKKDLLEQALKYANEKQLPVDFVEKFLGEDLDTTKSNLDGFSEGWSKALEGAIESKLKSNSYIPGGNDPNGNKVSIGASFAQQRNNTKASGQDPWSKE